MVVLPLFLPVRALGAEPRWRARVPPRDPTRSLFTLPLGWTKAGFEKATNTSCNSAFQRFPGVHPMRRNGSECPGHSHRLRVGSFIAVSFPGLGSQSVVCDPSG